MPREFSVTLELPELRRERTAAGWHLWASRGVRSFHALARPGAGRLAYVRDVGGVRVNAAVIDMGEAPGVIADMLLWLSPPPIWGPGT